MGVTELCFGLLMYASFHHPLLFLYFFIPQIVINTAHRIRIKHYYYY